MQSNDLFEQGDLVKLKLNQGIFVDRYYFGRRVIVNGQPTLAVILSDKSTLADLSSITVGDGKEKIVLGVNEFEVAGFAYKGGILSMFPSWSNNGVKAYLVGSNVSSIELFNKIRSKFDYFLDVKDPRLLDLVAVYTISTYCYSIFNSIGYLLLHSEKESGKTKMMDLIGLMCFNPVNATNPSESALFRVCDAGQPTLLIDDYENLEKEKRAVVNQLLKVGYKRGGQTIRSEKVGDTFEPQTFDVYCPKVISNTTGLDGITLNRCIVLRLLKTKTDKGAREPDEEDPAWQAIRDDCYTFVMNNWQAIQIAYRSYQAANFNNRQLELVKGLLSVAKIIDSTLATTLEDFLKESFEDRDMQDLTGDWKYLMFNSMLNNVAEPRFYAVSEISEWCRGTVGVDLGTKLNHWVGKQLSGVSLFKKRRVGKGVQYHLSKALVKEYMELQGYPVEDTQNIPTSQELVVEKKKYLSDFM